MKYDIIAGYKGNDNERREGDSTIEKRSGFNSDIGVEVRKNVRAELEEDVADAKALLRMAKRSGMESSRLSEKIDAARLLL